MKAHTYTNNLITETSPYLLQHAHNPVMWYPWCKKAFLRAKKEKKPIFLSIGYSTCHWCHVMEKEVFEDEEVANVLNEFFILIKVDREERPDIDQIYMKAAQIMTGTGGWPLNIFLTPERVPFYAATFIPKYGRNGRPGIIDLSEKIKKLWKQHHNTINKVSDTVMKQLKNSVETSKDTPITKEILAKTANFFSGIFDKENGGFGLAPKFPSPHNLLFLLRYWKIHKSDGILELVKKTLTSMRKGGIFDQIGFGFHRYSTDAGWLLPHFEKMLYDQAMLIMSYTETYQVTHDSFYKTTAEEILEYILRDMTSEEGGFYTAEDADSEGIEGRFYLWSYDELSEFLTPEELDFIVHHFNVTREGNYREESTGKKTGENILHFSGKPIQSNIPDKIYIDKIRRKIFSRREDRIHPFKDDKILAGWNGLMIAAIAKAASVFNDPAYLKTAETAASFILKKFRTNPGRLFHQYRNGQVSIAGFLDDYAFFIWGLIELYEATFTTRYLIAALEITETMIEFFYDKNEGGFYMCSKNANLIRHKEWMDNALPSGNSTAVNVLIRLSRLTGVNRYEEIARETVAANSGAVNDNPLAFIQLLSGLYYIHSSSSEIIVAGNPMESEHILKTLGNLYLPLSAVIFKPAGEENADLIKAAPYLKSYKQIDGIPTIYVCRNHQCSRPVHTIEKMLEILNAE